ncbi:GNAT family N-acetyltransferase [Streptomyces pluripotens]|uniref:GNAT family N-acetyltransferase n=1 Tax=Streptomyces pluripotens TaxID=1355015 RepID=A0A221NYA2_9ACTN|nr:MULTISPECIES: GNAT family N-acetyltransferase [Streptomyces]ARP70699.1 GNAT family N-acetyltransferase [Streptomyces pluripotens]ASN24961.1 GNAT family N-acetyltransferase [Streptomyces pluripotens]KIE27437.1 acetyltransferase [Streptomyces sp. MUSC 125]MCH0556604.1 GNAT family N-acetyltransferase [Streptomyces sp. MUM 16J]
MSITIRPYQQDDAYGIAELYNRHRDNPNPVAGGVSGEELDRELAERDTDRFLVAVDDGRVVGTFGLFHTTGRRSARAGELIADMFFVAPAYRNGVITGRLFTEAVEWMVQSGCLVLRLTVNPANSVAFKLYRRVGCVSVGHTVPGEDGNVELHNYIPLILRSVFADLGDEVRAALGQLSSFGTVTESRDGELRSDVRPVDGVRTVDYQLALGEFRLTASVDVDRGVVREAAVTGPDGAARSLRLTEPPYQVRATRRLTPHRFGSDGLVCELDGDDGTLRVLADGHHGPLLVSTWPSCRANRPAGWREGEPRDLDVVPVEGGVRVTERCGDKEVVGTVTLEGGVLHQVFAFTDQPGRIFQSVGLRQGTFVHPDGQHHPIGLGLGVRDASEVVAAAQPVPVGARLAWHGASVEIGMPVHEPARLIHSGLLERGLTLGADGVARLRTEFRGTAAVRTAATSRTAPKGGAVRRVELSAASAGVTSWKEGTTKVLRSPYPRTRAFGCNPRWSAGMWVTTEHSRFSRASGLGWGVRTAGGWEEKHPLALFAPRERIGWEVIAPEDPAEPVRVDIQAPDGEEEIVLWLTPNTPRKTTVVLDSAGTRWELASSDFRQVWAASASVRLSDGSWLDCRPAGPGAEHAELVLRTTSSGLLIGCVSPAARGTSWHLAVHTG